MLVIFLFIIERFLIICICTYRMYKSGIPSNQTVSFWFGPRGAGIRRLTSRQKIQGNQYQKERLIRHTFIFYDL